MNPLVELAGAGYAYEDGPAVLSGVDFGIVEGRALVLLGRNGSGKTTLMRLLSGGCGRVRARCGSTARW